MQILNNRTSILCPIIDFVEETGSLASAIAAIQLDSYRLAWDSVKDELINLGRTPDRTDEDGFRDPSRNALATAHKLFNYLCDAGEAAPQRIVASGDGGISFELHRDLVKDPKTGHRKVVRIEIDRDGSSEILVFKDSTLEARARLTSAS